MNSIDRWCLYGTIYSGDLIIFVAAIIENYNTRYLTWALRIHHIFTDFNSHTQAKVVIAQFN